MPILVMRKLALVREAACPGLHNMDLAEQTMYCLLLLFSLPPLCKLNALFFFGTASILTLHSLRKVYLRKMYANQY